MPTATLELEKTKSVPAAPEAEGEEQNTSSEPNVKHRTRPETWAASRAQEKEGEKEIMGGYFAGHDWLVRVSPGTSPRKTVASVLVNQGTTPAVVATHALRWIKEHAIGDAVFHVTWYSPGALVPPNLHQFREENPHLSAATHVHLFPGEVDLQLQAMISREAHEYAQKITRRFSYMLLSGYSLDLEAGAVRFQFDREIPMQATCALLKATQKFLFCDSDKFSGEGEIGYSFAQLLDTSKSVTIYTVSSSNDDEIKAGFSTLCGKVLVTDCPDSDVPLEKKTLRLAIIGVDDKETFNDPRSGYLKPGALQHNGSR
jgi:hypothetical protein